MLVALIAAGVIASAPDQTGATTTLPPAISAIPGEPADLSTGRTNTMTDPWTAIDVPDGARFNEMIRSEDRLVAVGSTGDIAHAWFSTNGAAWNPASQFEPAGDAGSSKLDHVVSWGGATVGIGEAGSRPGVWIAQRPAAWDFQGQTGLGPGFVPDIVAGNQLLALLATEDGREGWVSDDGVAWSSLGRLEGLTDVVVESYAAHDGWYFAMGSKNPDRSPAIYRSSDGRSWSPVSGFGVNSPSIAGAVMDLAPTDKGLIAVGWKATEQGSVPAIWTSSDGVSWTRSELDSDRAFSIGQADISVTELNARSFPSA